MVFSVLPLVTLSPPLVYRSYCVYECDSVLTCVVLSTFYKCKGRVYACLAIRIQIAFSFLITVFLIAEFQREKHLLFLEGEKKKASLFLASLENPVHKVMVNITFFDRITICL